MRPTAMIPLGVFLVLSIGAALVEYGQHSALMRSTALSDVAQLCGALRTERACPKTLAFPTRAAKDPWSRPYKCQATLSGLWLYTLGADAEPGGTRRDTDFACQTLYSQPDADGAEPCACFSGEEASARLRSL